MDIVERLRAQYLHIWIDQREEAATLIEQLRAELATVKQQREELLGALNEINDWLVCGCITSVDDMAQSFQYMLELSSAAIAKVKP